VLALANRPVDAGTIAQPAVTKPVALEHGRSLGDPAAPVTLTVWADFQCPACRSFTTDVEPRLVTDYVQPGKVKIVFRDLPFIGRESTDAAIAARCADDQGAFWRYHDLLYANQSDENSGAFSRVRLDAFADDLGLDRARFDSCLSSSPPRDAVAADRAAGTAAGIDQTPTLQTGGRTFSGVPTWTSLTAALDSQGSPAAASPSASTSASP
jgi:protein-disulfide isomerase